MERIIPTWVTPASPSRSQRSEEKAKSAAVGRERTFTQALEAEKTVATPLEPSEDRLAELLERVWEEGAALVRDPNLAAVQRYRRAVSAFLGLLVKMTYQATTRTGVRRRNGDVPVYTLIQTINAKLDGLARAILEGQKDSLELLRRTDELRGLLIDLLG